MPDGLSRAQVANVAALAHLELTDTELETFAAQLAEILAYVAALQDVDTTGVPPTATVAARGGSERADEIRPSLPRADALGAAPDAAANVGLFKVPRVIG